MTVDEFLIPLLGRAHLLCGTTIAVDIPTTCKDRPCNSKKNTDAQDES